MRYSVLSTIVTAGILGLACVSAQANQLNGSLPLAFIGLMPNGADLSTNVTLTAIGALVTAQGAGDYSPITFPTVFSTTPLSLANPTSFSISNSTWGSFTGSSFSIITRTPNNYDVALLGTYMPGPGLVGFSDSPSELRISVNRSGQSLSGAITLSTPPSDVPEPGSVALLAGLGVTGAGFLARRRRK